MAEPARKLDDDNEHRQLSAMERARSSWGTPGGDTGDSEPTPESGSDEEKSALDRAQDRWGDAEVHDGGKDKKDNKRSENSEPEIPFNPEGNKKKRGFHLTKKQGIAGGITGLLIGGGFGLFGIVSGPLQVIHFSQLLQQFHFGNNDDFANGRSSRYLYHRARAVGSGPGHAKMQTRLGVVGNRVADVMEIRMQNETGMRPVYDTRTGNQVGYEIIDENKAINAMIEANIDPDLDIDFNEGPVNNTVDSKGNPPNENRRTLMFKTDTEGGRVALKVRRNFHKAMTKNLGFNKVANAVAFRKSAARGGMSLHPLEKATRRADESFTDYARRVKESMRDRIRNGARAPNQVDLSDNIDDEGKVRQEAAEAQNEARATQAEATSGNKAAARARVAAGGSALTVGVLCAIRSISSNLEDVKHANIMLPLMRKGAETISIGAQAMTGQDITMDELGVVAQTLHSEEFGSWASARSIQSELGQELTGRDIPATAKPSRAGEKPTLLNIVDKIFGSIGGAGSLACSRIGQWTLDALTGGLILGAVTEVLGNVTGIRPTEMLAEWVVDTLAGEEVNVDAMGADLGNIANYGALVAANEQSLSLGGARLSSADVAKLDGQRRQERLQEFQKQSFFARVFSPAETNSVAAKVLFENSSMASVQNMSSAMISTGFQILPNLGKSLASIFTSSAHAQSGYDYGIDEYGFTAEEQESELVDDPYVNAEWIEGRLSDLNSEYGSCFSTTINPDTGAIEGNDTKKYSDIEDKCHDRSNEELVRYRFYIADMALVKSLSCYGGDQTHCSELGMGGGSGGSDATASTPSGPLPEGVVTAADTVHVPSCGGTGWTVHKSIASNVDAMCKQAAADGTPLTIGNSFRDINQQIELRKKHCGTSHYAIYEMPSSACRPHTALPGRSMHQRGLAIDFANCSSRSSACFRWLQANAARFGFKNLPSEPWHWSVNGS